VLDPAHREAQRLLFAHMLAANEAQTRMLAGTGNIADAQATALLRANREIEASGPAACPCSAAR
jgi:hypothetical protein